MSSDTHTGLRANLPSVSAILNATTAPCVVGPFSLTALSLSVIPVETEANTQNVPSLSCQAREAVPAVLFASLGDGRRFEERGVVIRAAQRRGVQKGEASVFSGGHHQLLVPCT